MSIPENILMDFAQRAGFGANLRNTHKVKLILLARMILEWEQQGKEFK